MYGGGALFPEVFKDAASPGYPTAATQTTQRAARGVCAPPPPRLTKQQFGLSKVSVQKDAPQDGAVILLLSKEGCICLGEVEGTGPCFSRDTCQDP